MPVMILLKPFDWLVRPMERCWVEESKKEILRAEEDLARHHMELSWSVEFRKQVSKPKRESLGRK